MTPYGPEHFRWHLRARWLGAMLLVLIAIVAHVRGYVESVWPLLAVGVAIAAYNAVLGSRGAALDDVRTARVAIALDIGALTCFLHFSGDIENPLVLGYVMPVAAAAVMLPMRAAIAYACGASVLLVTLVGLTLIDVLPHHHLALRSEVTLHGEADSYVAAMRLDYIVSRLMIAAAAALGTAYGFGKLTARIREKELELARENEQFELLLNTLPVGVVLLRRDGGVLLSNPAARRLLGIAEVDAFTRLNGAPVAEHLATFRGPIEEFETSERGRNFRHALARGAADEPIVWILEDRTKERQLVGQVIHQSKMADLGLLASGIAHEIGNPLSSISAMLQVMKLKGPGSDAAGQVDELESEVERINRIVQDITGFARPSTDRTSVPVAALVEQAQRLFQLHAKSRGVTLNVALHDGGTWVNVASDQVVQVILNLLLNAADASGDGGRVDIRTETPGDEARISVIDRGAGMDTRTRGRLFTPFFTTKAPGRGVGLGLFVSESIARAHGGRIDVETERGRGSTFTLCLPRGAEAER